MEDDLYTGVIARIIQVLNLTVEQINSCFIVIRSRTGLCNVKISYSHRGVSHFVAFPCFSCPSVYHAARQLASWLNVMAMF